MFEVKPNLPSDEMLAQRDGASSNPRGRPVCRTTVMLESSLPGADTESTATSDVLLILPGAGRAGGAWDREQVDEQTNARVSAWLNAKIGSIQSSWLNRPNFRTASSPVDELDALVEQLVQVLLHRKFNHQSRGRQQPILPGIRRRLREKVATGRPLTFFLLYNGGYRASPFPDCQELITQPDQTELLLLYQISLLQQKVAEHYPPGIEFFIVINNGVASWVNGIPLEMTEGYVETLRRMIHDVGAESGIRLLVQSEMPGFRQHPATTTAPALGPLTPREHSLVERFLGRACSEPEARQRFACYAIAEAKWAEHLAPVSESQGAVLLRQVAHPEMASFRPFPGGAIRAQNGTVGLLQQGDQFIPKLLTRESFPRHVVKLAQPMTLPPSEQTACLTRADG